MKRVRSEKIPPKKLLEKAQRAAAKGQKDKALVLFESSVDDYLKQGFSLKALAAAKLAKIMLGSNPRVRALLIRLYDSIGLPGDSRKEFDEIAELLRKDLILIFQGLDQQEFTDFLDIMVIEQISKGEVVLKQGQSGQDIFIVVSGRLEVVRDTERISIMHPGDIFGELGYFLHARRSASVKAIEKCMLIRLPSKPLRELCRKYPSVNQKLEQIYSLRVLQKAGEDLAGDPLFDLRKDQITKVTFAKGQAITLNSEAEIFIVKHGAVEIDFMEKGMKKKQFPGPGGIIRKSMGNARAGTDVVLLKVRPMFDDD